MPRTRTITPADVFENPDDEQTAQPIPGTRELLAPPESDELEETPAERIARLIGDLKADAGAVVRLYRVKIGGALEWCDDILPEEYEQTGQAGIRAKWGPGSYQIRVIGNRNDRNGKPQRNIIARDQFMIAPTPTATTAANSAGESEMAQTMRAFMEQAQRQNEALMAALTQKPDPHAQMMQTLQLMTAMREAMGGNQPTNAPAKSSLGEIVDAIRELRGVAEEINPPSESDNPILAALGPVLEIVKTTVNAQQSAAPQMPPLPAIAAPQSLMQRSPAAMPQRVSPPVTNQQPNTQSIPKAADMNIPPEFAELVAMLDEMLAMSAAGKEPSEGAEMLYEHLPDEMIELIASRFWYAQLALVIPRVAPHKEWLTKARDEFLAMLESEPEEDAPLIPSPGGIDGPTGPVGGETDFAG